MRHPLSTTTSGRASEGAQGVVVALSGGDLLVVELAGPAALGEAAEGPLVDRVAEVAVVRQPAGDDEVALAGTTGDRSPTGVALQGVRGLVLGDVFADLTSDPSCQAVSQAGEAQVDRPAPPGNAFPGSGSFTV